MELIDTFYQPGTIDCYTFVFDDQDPNTGYYAMLAMSEDGVTFSQWTDGLYDPAGTNEYLGERVDFHQLGSKVLDCFFARVTY